MSWGLYDELREKLLEMTQATSRNQSNEILIDLIDVLAQHLSPDFPSIGPLTDKIIAEWRKQQNAH